MKKSIALTIAILVMGSVPGLFQQNHLSKLREDHAKLMAEASGLGVDADSVNPTAGPRLTKRQRENLEKQARSASADILTFARELEDMRKHGGKPDEAFQQRAMEVLAKLAEFDPAQIRVFIDTLRNNPELSNETRGSLLAFSIMTLSEDHPEAAVALYAGASDLLEKNMLGEHVISSALENWAKSNPEQAIAWIGQHSAEFKGSAADDLKRSVIAGAALNDPAKAFELIDEMKFDQPANAVSAIVATGHENPEHRDAVLTGLRQYLAGITNEEERDEIGSKTLEIFARTTETEGFESLTDWMSEAKFSEKEKEQFAGGLTWFTTKNDTGRWVEWMAGNLSPENLQDPVRDIVGEWTQQDYVAAGQWLGKTPDGPAKTAAIEAYAEAVAEYEPQVAAQWAMTLPPGPARESTLRAIYQNWPASDPQGAAAFAREHGLE